jgi:branched-chain amino acid transport system substrate-binding protein
MSSPLDEALLASVDARKIHEHAAPMSEAFSAPASLVRKGDDTTVIGPVSLFDAMVAVGRKGLALQRYKGLGEMNPEQLWETTLDRTVRSLLQVRIKEVADADGAAAGEDRHDHDPVGSGRLSRRRISATPSLLAIERKAASSAACRCSSSSRTTAQARPGQADRREVHEDRAQGEAPHRHRVLERRGAVVPDVLDNGGIYVSPNAGPSNFAGKECHKNYFVVSWQNDTPARERRAERHEPRLQARLHARAELPGGQGRAGRLQALLQGRDRRRDLHRLDQTDFAAEMAQIRAAKPDVVFQFHPGGLGIAFLRQYAAGRAARRSRWWSPRRRSIRPRCGGGRRRAGRQPLQRTGTRTSTTRNKAFVAAFQKKYNRVPTYYASQGYDTALAIAAALKGYGRQGRRHRSVPPAMRKADFKSIRGPSSSARTSTRFRTGIRSSVEKGADGKPRQVTKGSSDEPRRLLRQGLPVQALSGRPGRPRGGGRHDARPRAMNAPLERRSTGAARRHAVPARGRG